MRGLSERARRPGAIVAALGALAVIPTSVLTHLPTVCLWRRLFDVECLGCGMTRAISSALHGDLPAAIALNAGVTVVLPAMAVAVICDVRAICFRDATQNHAARPRRVAAWLRHR